MPSTALPPRKTPGPLCAGLAEEGPAHDQHDAQAVIGQTAFHAGESDSVIRGRDDQRVVQLTGLTQGIQDHADALIVLAHTGVVVGHVAPHLRQVWQRRRGQDEVRVVQFGGRRELAVRVGKANSTDRCHASECTQCSAST